MTPEDVSLICNDLLDRQSYRRFYTKQINRQVNAAAALVRRELHLFGILDAGEDGIGIKDDKGIGVRVVAAIKGGKPIPEECPALVLKKVQPHILTFLVCVEPLEKERSWIELEMKKLARSLPVHEWQATVKGFGDLALAAIVGTTHNISLYPNPDKLKKRLGLAPYQGRAMSTWRSKGGLTSDDWKTLKYDPQARSVAFSDVAESMVKWQIAGAKNSPTGKAEPKGPYGKILLDYKDRQTAEHGDELSKGHINNRAKRYMTQRLVIDLWKAWHALTPMESLPLAA